MDKNVIFTLVEYKEKYNQLLGNYLKKYVDFDELDFLNDIELPKYGQCLLQVYLIEDEDDFLSLCSDKYDNSDKVYFKNMTYYDFVYSSKEDRDSEEFEKKFIREIDEKIKDENGQNDIEKAHQLSRTFQKIQDFLDVKRNYQIDAYHGNLEKQLTQQIEPQLTEPEQKTPYKIALLQELGFFNLDAIKKLSKTNQYKVIETITGGTHRTIKGNVLVLDPNSNENRMTYTSNNHIDEVKNYLDKLK